MEMTNRNVRKQKEGVVASVCGKKTIVVLCERKLRHPKYKKIIKLSSKFKVHDEKETAKLGDKVLIEETRRLSKTKHYRLVSVLGKGAAPKRELPKKKEIEPSDTGNVTTAGS
jgi:small subunit ribosomal protein S17